MDDLGCRSGQVGTGAGDKDRSKYESFERAQRYSLQQSLELEGAEHFAFAAFESVFESVGQERVSAHALHLLHKQPLDYSPVPTPHTRITRSYQAPQQPHIGLWSMLFTQLREKYQYKYIYIYDN
jgi:hypothetical protein